MFKRTVTFNFLVGVMAVEVIFLLIILYFSFPQELVLNQFF